MIKRILLLITMLTCMVTAASERNDMPNPELIPEADCYSIAVVQLRENDEPIKALLEAALKSISSGETKLPASMADVSSYLSGNNRADMLFAGLPFQTVRCDRMVNGQTQGITAVTLAGWKGLQVNVRNSLSGKAYPTTRYRVTDLVQRDVNVMCQVNGTFVFTPDADSAKKVVDRLAPKDKPLPPVSSPTLAAFRALPKTSDAYGVVINQKGAFSQLRNDAGERYCSLTETLSLAPAASITEIRMKPLPGGCHCVSRRRCGAVTGAPSTSQV